MFSIKTEAFFNTKTPTLCQILKKKNISTGQIYICNRIFVFREVQAKVLRITWVPLQVYQGAAY